MASDSSDYPAAIDSFTAPGAKVDDTGGADHHEDMHLKEADAIVQTQTEIGANASWWMGKPYADAEARDAEITAPETGMTAYVEDEYRLTRYAHGAWWPAPPLRVCGWDQITSAGDGDFVIIFEASFPDWSNVAVFTEVLVTSGTHNYTAQVWGVGSPVGTRSFFAGQLMRDNVPQASATVWVWYSAEVVPEGSGGTGGTP